MGGIVFKIGGSLNPSINYVFHHAVDVVFHMLPLPSHKAVDLVIFPCVVTAHVISSEWFSICCHCCALSSVCDFPHVVTAFFQITMDVVFKEQWVCCDNTFVTAISLCIGCGFPHVITALSQKGMDLLFRVLSLHTCCHCSLSNISGCIFPYVVTAYLVSRGWFSICFPCCLTSQLMFFPYFATNLFQRAVNVVFFMLPPHI